MLNPIYFNELASSKDETVLLQSKDLQRKFCEDFESKNPSILIHLDTVLRLHAEKGDMIATIAFKDTFCDRDTVVMARKYLLYCGFEVSLIRKNEDQDMCFDVDYSKNKKIEFCKRGD